MRRTDLAAGTAPPAAKPRRAWMDNLRIVLISGVIVAHAATAYVVDVGWYYEERTTSEVSETLFSFPVFLGGIFGLSPLLVMAGWLSVSSLRRRGASRFVRARLVRLGIPLVLFAVLVDPLADWLGGTAAGETRSLVSYLTDVGGDRDVGPMWFVAAILVFSVGYAVLRARRPAPDPAAELRVRHLAVIAATIAVLDVLTWLRWGYLSDTWWDLNWQHWPQAAGLFALGVLAGERGWLRALPAHVERRAAWVSVAGLAALCALAAYSLSQALEQPDFTEAGASWGTAVFAVIDGAVAVALSIWVMAWFERRWNGPPGRVTAAAARGSYATYVLHPVPMVLLSWLLAPVALAPELKFAVVAALAVPLCFVVGYAVTRIPGVGRVL
ncbi:MAG TPA: acyltransferase [Nocardioidaceae bacterium]|nr:acyltransferase [Nocardioidaceae bacterium]